MQVTVGHGMRPALAQGGCGQQCALDMTSPWTRRCPTKVRCATYFGAIPMIDWVGASHLVALATPLDRMSQRALPTCSILWLGYTYIVAFSFHAYEGLYIPTMSHPCSFSRMGNFIAHHGTSKNWKRNFCPM